MSDQYGLDLMRREPRFCCHAEAPCRLAGARVRTPELRLGDCSHSPLLK
jgi:hypothetical protein